MTAQDLDNYLRKYEVYPDFVNISPDGSICVGIDWGDWKHDHLRADYLMRQLGYELVEERVTDDDGSDTYSSEHYYKRPY